MSKRHEQIFPHYIPYYYRGYLILRKLWRQTTTRLEERKFRKSLHLDHKEQPPLKTHENPFQEETSSILDNSPSSPINKSASQYLNDLKSSEIVPMVTELNQLMALLKQKGLKYSNPAGNFLERLFQGRYDESRKMWEFCWILKNLGLFKSPEKKKILGIGGASTIFSFYLAHCGHEVIELDNDWSNCGLIYNSNYVANQMNWKLKAMDFDVTKPFPFSSSEFDCAKSICVLEHLSVGTRKNMMRELGRVLKPQGIVGLTMDYDSSREIKSFGMDQGLRFFQKEKILSQIIQPSRLNVLGNPDWVDDCPPEFFLGALFLTKQTEAG